METCAGGHARVKIQPMSGVRIPRVTARLVAAVAIALSLHAARLAAHPAPFSYLDVHLGPNGLGGRLVVHTIDVAHELGLGSPALLIDASLVAQHTTGIATLLAPRVRFTADGVVLPWSVTSARPLAGQDAVEIGWEAPAARTPGQLSLDMHVFPYDPNHQTFVNVYEDGALVRQEVFNSERTGAVFYSGTRQGLLAVVKAFTASGVHHIAIGPDHILFIVGLLLLGGSLPKLLAIVTAFTLGHSVTLALATLNIVDPPSRLVEPAIALSIVYIGADNLLVGTSGRDVRAWVALAFGLVHGFGFASVLRETGLPDRALGLSLFSFNLGVEIGQALIVIVVASALAIVRRRNALVARHVVTAGSITVMLAGAFWFFERVF
jgi:hydrogenase/urease accessory protein HupE